MADYQLYCFAQSGNSYKPALLLTLCGADWEPVWVDFFNGGTKTPAFLAINPMGEAPVLVHGEERLVQSGVMLITLAERFGSYSWADETERREILRWLLWDNHKLTGYTATWRFMLNFLPEAKRNADVVAAFGTRALTAMKVLERHLTDRAWIVADRPTIADLSCCGYLFWLDEVGQAPDDWPAIAAWLDRIRALPNWAHPYALMPGHPRPAVAG